VLFIESARLYRIKGLLPEEEYTVPFGEAEVKREGKDVTIFAISQTVHRALAAAEILQKHGVSVEVIDPRTLAPLDKDRILASVKKTGRLVTVEDSCRTGGVGAEIAAIVVEEVFDYLDAPIVRVASLDAPAPFTPPLQEVYMPNEERIVEAVKSII